MPCPRKLRSCATHLRVRRSRHVACVEMEGAAVAQVCYEHDVPVAVVRAISDKADHSAVINFPRFVDKVASHFTCGIVREFIAQT